MKQLTMAILSILTVASTDALCQNARIGMDIGSLISIEAARIVTEYGFSPNWSVGGEAGIDIRMLKRKIKQTEYEHRKTIDESDDIPAHDDAEGFQDASIFVQFWPQKIFRGPGIYIGGCIRDRLDAEAMIGAGYYCHIWKRLGTGISFRICLLETLKIKEIKFDSIQIRLYYEF